MVGERSSTFRDSVSIYITHVKEFLNRENVNENENVLSHEHVEVENEGVMTIFIKSFPGKKKMEKHLYLLKRQFSHTLSFRNNFVL